MTLTELLLVQAEPHGSVDGGELPCSQQPQADALSARRWAINEVGAAIAHELIEPLTALLLYMHEINWLTKSAPDAVPDSARSLVEAALAETKRVCAIMERIGSRFEAPLDSEAAIRRGYDASRWWSRVSGGAGEPAASAIPAGMHCLTRREREVLDSISGGHTNKEGALRLKISPRTFESHRARIMRKLAARNAADLLRKVLAETP